MPGDYPVLIVSGDSAYRESVAKTVGQCGLRPVCCSLMNDACALFARVRFSVAICGDDLPDGHYRGVIQEAQRVKPRVPVIVVSRRADWDAYLKAIGMGAFDYVAPPDDPGETVRILETALRHSNSLEKVDGVAGAAT